MVRVFIDRYGDFYPPATDSIDDAQLLNSSNLLRNYYDARYARQFNSNDSARREHDWSELLAHHPSVKRGSFEETWAALQDTLVAEYGRAVTAAAGPNHAVLALLHGFNNSQDEIRASYDSVAKVVLPKSNDAALLEVFWDGLNVSWFFDTPAVWGAAQHNTYFIGLGFRRLLNEISPSTPIRMLTHSSGGIVATTALWNIESKTQDKRGRLFQAEMSMYRANRDDAKRFRTPSHPDIRLAMMAPAMPGITFDDYLDRTPSTSAVRTPALVIVGPNEDDRVLDKYVGLASSHGSTSLGRYVSQYTLHAAPLNKGQPKTRVSCVNFTSLTTEERATAHNWVIYITRPAAAEMYELLFGDASNRGPRSCDVS